MGKSEQLEEDLKLLDSYLSGFAAGTIAVKEAFARVSALAQDGAVVDLIHEGILVNRGNNDTTEFDVYTWVDGSGARVDHVGYGATFAEAVKLHCN